MMKKKKIGLYIFLSIITLGIYSIFFWYRWTEEVNTLCIDDDDDSANYLLVCILSVFTCGIYTFVWNYKMAERIYQKSADYGVQLKHGGMFIMLWRLFLPIVSSIYKISYVNKLIDGYNAKLAAPAVEE
jgi:hypothetical protein